MWIVAKCIIALILLIGISYLTIKLDNLITDIKDDMKHANMTLW